VAHVDIGFHHGDNMSFAFRFFKEWSGSIKTSSKTCMNADSAPACFKASGSDIFWVCRTLTDPYSGVPSSKTLCTGEGSFLEENDACGCCSDMCPKPCPCDLEGTGDGVWIVMEKPVELPLENITEINGQRCVDPRWAVSATASFPHISCLNECPTDNGN
jgi:hypothetical protein